MKTIITSSGPNVTSSFDKRFGRSAWYCLYDEVSRETLFIENNNLEIRTGAGEKAFDLIKSLGVQKVISGDFGPKVQHLLDSDGIQMVILPDDNFFVKDIITLLDAKNPKN